MEGIKTKINRHKERIDKLNKCQSRFPHQILFALNQKLYAFIGLGYILSNAVILSKEGMWEINRELFTTCTCDSCSVITVNIGLSDTSLFG